MEKMATRYLTINSRVIRCKIYPKERGRFNFRLCGNRHKGTVNSCGVSSPIYVENAIFIEFGVYVFGMGVLSTYIQQVKFQNYQ